MKNQIRSFAACAVLLASVASLAGCSAEAVEQAESEHTGTSVEALGVSCAQILCAPGYRCIDSTTANARCVKDAGFATTKKIVRASVERTGGGTSELSRLRGFNEDGTLAAVAELRVDAGGYAELSLSVLARDRWKTRITKNATKEGLLAFTGEKFDDDFDRRGRELVLVASPDGGTSAGPIGCGIAVAGAVVACGATAPVVAACALAAAAAICACNEGC